MVAPSEPNPCASATSPAYVAHASRCRSALRRRLVVVVRAAAAASGRMGSGDHRAAACQLLNKIAMSCLSMPREASQAISHASWGRGMRRGRWDAPVARPGGAKVRFTGLKKMCLSADNRQVDRLPPSRVTADFY
jgi:hypothetical protein